MSIFKLIPSFTFILLFTTLSFVNAQLKEEYLPGTITMNSGETLSGFIKNENLDRANTTVNFKKLLSDKKSIKLKDSALSSVKYNNGETFEMLHIMPDGQQDSISLFARLIVKGKVSLYKTVYLKDEMYVIARDGMTYPLQPNTLESGELEVSNHFYKFYLKSALKLDELNTNIDEIPYSRESFIKLVAEYNKSVLSENSLITIKNKPIHFTIIEMGGGQSSKNNYEIYFRGLYRTYFPYISRSTSLNIGLQYYQYNYQDYNYFTNPNFIRKLFAIPIQLQQNLLNKSVRPYLSTGINLSYISDVNETGVDYRDVGSRNKGFQQDYGFNLIFSAGIEVDIIKGFMARAEYRFEDYTHPLLIGVGYHF